MRLEVTWSVSGTTEIDLTAADIAQAKAAGVDLWDQAAIADWFVANRPDLFGSSLVDDFSERDSVQVEEVMAWGLADEDEDEA